MPKGIYNRNRCEKIKLICKQCSREFEVYPSEKNRKYCSKQCAWKSPERKKNISESHKGKIAWNKDLQGTDLTKPNYDARVAKNTKNSKHPRSKEVKDDMKGRCGVYKRTSEHNRINKEAQRIRWDKTTKEERLKLILPMLKVNQKRWAEMTKEQRRERMLPAIKAGQKRWDNMTKEERKEYCKPLYEAGYVATQRLLKNPEYLKKVLRRRIPTGLEIKFQSIVDKYGLPYKYVGNGSFILGGKCPDFINTNNEKIAIEVYARYHKRWPDKTIEEWKMERSKVFEKYGWKIIYFDEIEVNEKNVLEKIK